MQHTNATRRAEAGAVAEGRERPAGKGRGRVGCAGGAAPRTRTTRAAPGSAGAVKERAARAQVNEAALIAGKRGQAGLTPALLDEAMDKAQMGGARQCALIQGRVG